jgi:hypothetical protein
MLIGTSFDDRVACKSEYPASKAAMKFVILIISKTRRLAYDLCCNELCLFVQSQLVLSPGITITRSWAWGVIPAVQQFASEWDILPGGYSGSDGWQG